MKLRTTKICLDYETERNGEAACMDSTEATYLIKDIEDKEYCIEFCEVSKKESVINDRQDEYVPYKITNNVTIYLPEGEKRQMITREDPSEQARYCNPIQWFLEGALKELGLDYNLNAEQIVSIDGLQADDSKSWNIYANGHLSSYPVGQHCTEDGWEIELKYE